MVLNGLVVVEVHSAYWGTSTIGDFIVVWRIRHYTDVSLPMGLDVSAYAQALLYVKGSSL